MFGCLGADGFAIELNHAHFCNSPGRGTSDGYNQRTGERRSVGCPFHYLPPPLAPRSTICRAFSMLSDPPTWLGGYSLNVWRKPPTRVTAGTMVQSFSPHQRAYIID